MPRWLELSVSADAEAVEAVSEILHRIAPGGVAIEPPFEADREGDYQVPADRPWTVKAFVPADESAPAISFVEQALWHLHSIWPVGELATREVEEDDWANAWKEHYHPIRIGRHTVICPRWRDVASDDSDVLIRLDPGMAFGTGLHPTTQLCLEAIEELDLAGRSVLDLGCGSGVLAISAAMHGARNVQAMDVDPIAVRTTAENAEGNGVGEIITAIQGTLPVSPSVRYDCVLANIIARVIADLAGDLYAATSPNGVLVASGIIDDKLGAVEDALRRVGFECESRRRGDWYAIMCHRAGG